MIDPNQSVAVQQPKNEQAVYIPSQADWDFMMKWGTQAIKSGMLPNAIKSPEAAAMIVLKGRELGMSFMSSFAHIHVINGKPSMSAESMQAMARKNLPGLVINIIESDSEKAVVEFIRPERNSRAFKLSFTMEDARRAELLSNPTWKKYPAAMLWSRAVSAGLRRVCPEALLGVSYTPEELGANVNESGDVVETTHRTLHETTTIPDAFKKPTARPTKEQLADLYGLYKQAGYKTKEAVHSDAVDRYKNVTTLLDLTIEQYTELTQDLLATLRLQNSEPPAAVETPKVVIAKPKDADPSAFENFESVK